MNLSTVKTLSTAEAYLESSITMNKTQYPLQIRLNTNISEKKDRPRATVSVRVRRNLTGCFFENYTSPCGAPSGDGVVLESRCEIRRQ